MLNAKKQTRIKGLEWIGERIGYPENAVQGDTFPMTWADDDRIYTSAGDPVWGNCLNDDGLDVQKFTGNPTDYFITRLNLMHEYVGYAGTGPKPTGMICVEGKLYLAFQNMKGNKPPAHGSKSQHGSDACIVTSVDHGLTWTPSLSDISEPMFPGHRFGGPAFINFGKDNENAPDEYVYAVSTDQWDNGSELRLGRVPSDQILNGSSWQWVCGFDEQDGPLWTSNLAESTPVFQSPRSLSLPDMVYIKGIDRYLLLTCRFRQDFSPQDGTDLLMYEAQKPWGPFSLVFSQEYWAGKQVNPYCPRLPLKWFDQENLIGWLQFSGSWNCPEDTERHRPYYRSNLQQFKFLLK